MKMIEKLTPKKHRNIPRMNKKVFLIGILIGFLIIPMITAFEWDNVKSYDSEKQKITVKNSIIGIPTTKVAELTLLTPTRNLVEVGGNRIVAEIEITNYEDNYNNVFAFVEFSMFGTDTEINKDFYYLYEKVVGTEKVPIYETVCSEKVSINDSRFYMDCVQEISGYKDVDITEWELFNEKTDLPIGTIKIGIATNVEEGEHTEWIPTYFGVRIDEWASFVGFTKYEFMESNDDGTNAFETRQFGMNFTIGNVSTNEAFKLEGIALLTFKNGAGANCWVNVTDEENPSATDSWGTTLANGTYDSSALGASPGTWENITLSTAPDGIGSVVLLPDTVYSWLLQGDGTDPDGCGIRLDGSSPNYTGGQVQNSFDEISISTLAQDYTFRIFGSPAIIITTTLNSPINDVSTNDLSRVFNGTFVPRLVNLTNATLSIWHSNNSIFNQTTNLVTGNITNSTTYNITNFVTDNYLWNIEACGLNSTSGKVCGFAENNFTFEWISFVVDEQEFNVSVLETENQKFTINITTLEEIQTVTSQLIYNGTTHQANTICSGITCGSSVNIDIPLVTAESQNKTFFWQVTIFDGVSSFSSNTTPESHNVSQIHLEKCDGTFTTKSLNFSSWDEPNRTMIDPYKFGGDFSIWIGTGTEKRNNTFDESSITELNLCIKQNRTYFTDANIEYDEAVGSTYIQRNYFLQNNTIDNVLQHRKLFLLPSSLSTSFIIKVQDDRILPLPDHLVQIQRFYPGTGSFETVQIVRTDDNGQSVGFFKTETVDYRFIISVNNTVLLTTEKQKVVGESVPFTLTFTIGVDLGAPWQPYENVTDLTHTLSFNKTTNLVVFQYEDSSTDFTSSNLIVQRLNSSSENIVVCSVISSQASATLSCDLTSNETGSYVARGFITREEEFLVEQLPFSIEDFTELLGLYGVFLGWFIILVSAFAFKFNEIAGIVMINLSIIFTNLIGLISFGKVFITAIIAVSIVIVVILEK